MSGSIQSNRREPSRNAFVTLVTNDNYVPGALVVLHALKLTLTKCEVVCLAPKDGISEGFKGRLEKSFDKVKWVTRKSSNNEAELNRLGRPDLRDTYTKLELWNPDVLGEYDMVCYIDCDFIIIRNIDNIFDGLDEHSRKLKEGEGPGGLIAAVPDLGWPDWFNSGLMVLTPGEKTYTDLCDMVDNENKRLQEQFYGLSYDGADQGLLNRYFSNWSRSGDTKSRLGFVYNVTGSSFYAYESALRANRNKIKAVHFAGQKKPWDYNRKDGRGELIKEGMISEFWWGWVRLWWSVHDEFVSEYKFWKGKYSKKKALSAEGYTQIKTIHQAKKYMKSVPKLEPISEEGEDMMNQSGHGEVLGTIGVKDEGSVVVDKDGGLECRDAIPDWEKDWSWAKNRVHHFDFSWQGRSKTGDSHGTEQTPSYGSKTSAFDWASGRDRLPEGSKDAPSGESQLRRGGVGGQGAEKVQESERQVPAIHIEDFWDSTGRTQEKGSTYKAAGFFIEDTNEGEYDGEYDGEKGYLAPNGVQRVARERATRGRYHPTVIAQPEPLAQMSVNPVELWQSKELKEKQRLNPEVMGQLAQRADARKEYVVDLAQVYEMGLKEGYAQGVRSKHIANRELSDGVARRSAFESRRESRKPGSAPVNLRGTGTIEDIRWDNNWGGYPDKISSSEVRGYAGDNIQSQWMSHETDSEEVGSSLMTGAQNAANEMLRNWHLFLVSQAGETQDQMYDAIAAKAREVEENQKNYVFLTDQMVEIIRNKGIVGKDKEDAVVLKTKVEVEADGKDGFKSKYAFTLSSIVDVVNVNTFLESADVVGKEQVHDNYILPHHSVADMFTPHSSVAEPIDTVFNEAYLPDRNMIRQPTMSEDFGNISDCTNSSEDPNPRFNMEQLYTRLQSRLLGMQLDQNSRLDPTGAAPVASKMRLVKKPSARQTSTHSKQTASGNNSDFESFHSYKIQWNSEDLYGIGNLSRRNSILSVVSTDESVFDESEYPIHEDQSIDGALYHSIYTSGQSQHEQPQYNVLSPVVPISPPTLSSSPISSPNSAFEFFKKPRLKRSITAPMTPLVAGFQQVPIATPVTFFDDQHLRSSFQQLQFDYAKNNDDHIAYLTERNTRYNKAFSSSDGFVNNEDDGKNGKNDGSNGEKAAQYRQSRQPLGLQDKPYSFEETILELKTKAIGDLNGIPNVRTSHRTPTRGEKKIGKAGEGGDSSGSRSGGDGGSGSGDSLRIDTSGNWKGGTNGTLSVQSDVNKNKNKGFLDEIQSFDLSRNFM